MKKYFILTIFFYTLFFPVFIFSQDKETDLWKLSIGYGRNTYKAPYKLKYFDSNALHLRINRNLNNNWNINLSIYQYSRQKGDNYINKKIYILFNDIQEIIETEDNFETQEENYFSFGLNVEYKLFEKNKHKLFLSLGPCVSKYQYLGIWHQSNVNEADIYSLTGFVSENQIDFGFDGSIRYEYVFENNFIIGPLLNVNFLSEGGSFLIFNFGHSF